MLPPHNITICEIRVATSLVSSPDPKEYNAMLISADIECSTLHETSRAVDLPSIPEIVLIEVYKDV